MEVYVVRHGETEAGKNKIIADIKEPLNSNGIQQAKNIGKELCELNIDVVYYSPIERAKHTLKLFNLNDNIIFIIPPTTYNEVFNEIGFPNEYEKIQEYKNSIFWSFDLKNYRKSNWWNKTASTNISDKITIRTANTMKKVLEICKKINRNYCLK